MLFVFQPLDFLDHLLIYGIFRERRVFACDPCPLQSFLPKVLLDLLVHGIRSTDVGFAKGKVTTHVWVDRFCCKINHVDSSFGGSPDGWIHKAKQRPQWPDDEFRQQDQHVGRIGSQSARVGESARVDSNSRDVA